MHRLVVSLVLVLAGIATARAADNQLSAQSVREAIDRGVSFLKQEQLPSGGWR